MPAIPPMAVKIIDEKENIPLPHREGTKLPIVEPTKNPIHIIDFVLIVLFRTSR